MKSTNFGSICIVLKFFPNESKLGVTILECANLPSTSELPSKHKVIHTSSTNSDGSKISSSFLINAFQLNICNRAADPRVTVTLLHEGKKAVKKSTRVCYKTKNPYFDEELVFTATLAQVEVCNILVL